MDPLAERQPVQLSPRRRHRRRRGAVALLQFRQHLRQWPRAPLVHVDLVQLWGEPVQPAFRRPGQRAAAVREHIPHRPAGTHGRAVEGLDRSPAQNRQQASRSVSSSLAPVLTVTGEG
jgi:hypothetical protein